MELNLTTALFSYTCVIYPANYVPSLKFLMRFSQLLTALAFFILLCRQQQLRSYETSQYKMNYLETPTGLKMVLNTDPAASGVAELMKTIYQV